MLVPSFTSEFSWLDGDEVMAVSVCYCCSACRLGSPLLLN